MDVIVGSSRTYGMDKMSCVKDYNVEVITKPGATYRRLGTVISDHAMYHEPLLDQNTKTNYYIVGGLCDLTKKLKDMKYSEVVYLDTPLNALGRMKSEIISIRNIVLELNATPVFCTVCPQHIATYNNNQKEKNRTSTLKYCLEYDKMQQALEQIINSVNLFINQINHELNVKTPLLHRCIQHFKGKGHPPYYRYSKFTDGCHPDLNLRNTWAENIVRVMKLNRQ
jgi:hypothetical protein